ncbi:MAG: NAD-dependent epimerase/dehydratase family protein, partial [Acidimicrobiaceae bacterium]|nr:NAD-dependent epimerase/dehydratase family protein [Acidimicrobiaceae bacterium]
GLGSYWGGSVAQALEADPDVEVVIGVDTSEPTVPLERTEFVRTDENFSILSRIVAATDVDTIVHAALVVDSTRMADQRIHENNVIGTLNLLAALSHPQSSVTDVIVKSSALVYGAGVRDPHWFDEDAERTTPARTRVERTLLEVESQLHDFMEDNPRIRVAVLRFANVLGDRVQTPLGRALTLPAVPQIFGFDPLLQFVEQQDVVRAMLFAVERRLSGVFNVAADGRHPWSELIAIAGKLPVYLPPVLTGLAVEPLARLHILDLPSEVLDLLRYGRGVDNRRFKAAGYTYHYTTAAAVRRLAEAHRVRAAVGEDPQAYHYEADVEEFFRRSPAVVRRS